MLRGVLEDSTWLTNVASNSFRHVLGFDKFVLISLRPLGQLRLHVWWPDEQRVREDVHDHRFDFYSFVLTGTMRVRLYRSDPEGPLSVRRFEETAIPHEQRWRFTESGLDRLKPDLVADYAAGTFYRLGADALHRVETPKGLVVSVVLEMDSIRHTSSVYVPASSLAPHPLPQQRFTADDVEAKLQRLLHEPGQVP